MKITLEKLLNRIHFSKHASDYLIQTFKSSLRRLKIQKTITLPYLNPDDFPDFWPFIVISTNKPMFCTSKTF